MYFTFDSVVMILDGDCGIVQIIHKSISVVQIVQRYVNSYVWFLNVISNQHFNMHYCLVKLFIGMFIII